MHKWLLIALAILVAIVAVGCKQSTQTPPPVAPIPPTATKGEQGAGVGSPAAATGEAVTVEVRFRLPKEEPRLLAAPASGMVSDRAGAPSAHLVRVLGATIGGPGCTVTQVSKGGLAEKSGIKAGDVVVKCNGGEPDCAATLDSWLYCGREPGMVEMTLKRGGGGEACGGESCATEAGKAAEPPDKESK
jgi:hypothetical protein